MLKWTFIVVVVFFFNTAIQICSDDNLFNEWLMNLDFFVCVDVVVRK